MGRHLDLNTDMQITVAVALKVFYALAFDPEGGAGLRAGRNFDRRLAVQGWHLDFRADSHLHKADPRFAKQIVAVALEKLVRFNVQDDVQITRRSSAEAGFAVAG